MKYHLLVELKMLIGYPGETKEEILSYTNLKDLNYIRIGIGQVLPLPHTQLRKTCEKLNCFTERLEDGSICYEVNTDEWDDQFTKQQIKFLNKELNRPDRFLRFTHLLQQIK